MKPYPKRLLIAVVLLLTFAFSTLLHAEETPPANHTKIEFKDYNSYKELLNLFPDAAPIIKQYSMQAAKSTDAIIKSNGMFARVTDKLYIYRSEAQSDCGQRGCTTVPFSVNENGFYPSALIITAMSPPEYTVDQYEEPSFFTCTVDLEWVEWKRRDGMEMTGEPLPTDDCSRRFMNTFEETTP